MKQTIFLCTLIALFSISASALSIVSSLSEFNAFQASVTESIDLDNFSGVISADALDTASADFSSSASLSLNFRNGENTVGLASSPSQDIVINFTQPTTGFGLIFDTPDNYNFIEYFNGNTSLGTLVGNANNIDFGATGFSTTHFLGASDANGITSVRISSTRGAFELYEFQIVNSAIPEPSTYALFGLAVLGIIIRKRK